MAAQLKACSSTKLMRFVTAVCLVLSMAACETNPADSTTKQAAKTGAAVGAGFGLLVGALAGDAEVAAAAMAVGAAAGAVEGGYEGWRQDQEDVRTREIAQAIRGSGGAAQQTQLDQESRQREQLTRFLGVWQMAGWLEDPADGRIDVTAQVNGDMHMNYFVQLSYIDLKAAGLDARVWGSTTLGYTTAAGFEISTRFNTLPDALEMQGGSYDQASRSFTFTGEGYRTVIAFSTPDRFTAVTTDSRGGTIESYQFTRS